MKTLHYEILFLACITFLVSAVEAQSTPGRKLSYSYDTVIEKLIKIESNGNHRALGDWTKLPVKKSDGTTGYIDYPMAVGILQLHPIMVREANRIIGQNKYTLNDRFNPDKSKEMCKIYLSHQVYRYRKKYGEAPTELRLACSWNSGNIFKQLPKAYKNKYLKLLEI